METLTQQRRTERFKNPEPERNEKTKKYEDVGVFKNKKKSKKRNWNLKRNKLAKQINYKPETGKKPLLKGQFKNKMYQLQNVKKKKKCVIKPLQVGLHHFSGWKKNR